MSSISERDPEKFTLSYGDPIHSNWLIMRENCNYLACDSEILNLTEVRDNTWMMLQKGNVNLGSFLVGFYALTFL